MDFFLLEPEKLKVSLTREDMDALELDYDAMDYNDPATRIALTSLLDKGRAQTGFHPRRAKLYIEVFPTEDGGCVICYTKLPGGEVLPSGQFQPGPAPVVFAFDHPGPLLEACRQLHSRYAHRILQSSLCQLGTGYRLILYPLDYADPLTVSMLLEYGTSMGEGSILAAYAQEHGTLLVPEDAVELLAGLA